MIRPIGRFLVLFFVFTVLVEDVESITNFTITGTLLCPHRFDYYTLLVEKDTKSGDDIFNTSQSPGNSPGTSTTFKTFGQLSSDEVFDNDKFEVAIRVVHNCNTPVKPYREYEMFIGDFPNKDTHYVKDIGQIQLHNLGKPTTAPIGKRRRPNNKKNF
ncbi:hypothetical protein CAEBREN_18460 [Caenorhabditis brenneri]|uniref:Uncharacterized protein n=1 Tax=Caenorhabditis brenneri TaxID=135651 RepID=G0MB30_CAEBE|nr:hypothetical protein CAEBREN_18460 [Caenorhabditis brenneri]